MPEDSPGVKPEKVESSSSGERRNRKKRRTGQQEWRDKKEVFKGNIPGMEEYVFDTVPGKGADQFPSTMYELAINFGGNIRGSGHLTKALDPDQLVICQWSHDHLCPQTRMTWWKWKITKQTHGNGERIILCTRRQTTQHTQSCWDSVHKPSETAW
mmetsp:Transcript_14901/g.22755  ORF Transcript_14901/g.22755 Transcript_14901/m.22755 type:complete len:156 (-) Transcript_14901:837-1304(-)